jgi:hypothetical protein
LRARGVLAASKVIGAALSPQPSAITVQSITSFATDLEYGGKRVLGIADVLTEMERFRAEFVAPGPPGH